MRFERSFEINGRTLSDAAPAYLVAEAGVNHNGKLENAFNLVDAAAAAGVDAVKFQIFKTERLILEGVEKAPYQKRNAKGPQSQFEMLKALELSPDQHLELKRHCDQRGVTYLTTPFDLESLDALDRFDLPAYKIASTDATNPPFLRAVAAKGKPVLLSVGMCYQEEVAAALRGIHPFNRRLALLQCVANYPIRDDEANLAVISTFKRDFDVLVGYSDHTVGVGASPFAVAMGAKVIEKHFTLDRGQDGPDHKSSLLPSELAELVRAVRRVESFLGDGFKTPSLSELGTRASLQKNLVAARDLKAGEPFAASDLLAIRTGGRGVPAFYHDQLLGQQAKRDFKRGEPVEP